MRTIWVGIAGAALCGVVLSSCSSSGSSSVTAPTATGVSRAGTGGVGPTNDNNPNFWQNSLSVTPGEWKGPTTPNTTPTTGHPGDLTIVFSDNVFVEATLRWERIPNAADNCHIEAVPSTPDFPMQVTCGGGGNDIQSVVVHPSVPTIYRFYAMKGSEEWWKSFDIPVTVATDVSITATWKSTLGAGDDDPGVTYSGHVHAPLNGEIQVDTDTPTTYCGLSGDRSKLASHFHASMKLNSEANQMTGTYDSQLPSPGADTCLQDHGKFTLNKQQ